MWLKRIKSILYEVRYLKKTIKKYGDSLLQGRYILFPSMRAMVADNTASLENAKPYFEKKSSSSKMQRLISKLNQSKYYFNKNKGSSKKYEALYVANNYDKIREIKLFSFERKEILTICTSAEACIKQISEYEKWHKYFKMPPVVRQDKYENGYEIAMVELQPRPAEVYALSAITHCFSMYAETHNEDLQEEQVSNIIHFCYNEEMNSFLQKISESINPEVLKLKIPICLQHGDLSRDNLMYGQCSNEMDFWWIDWEHARNRIFFYDYFFYILNTAIYFSDLEGIKAYLNGNCDEHLKKYFESFNLQYDPRYRKDYFMVFSIVFLKERVCDTGRIKALEMYCDFIHNTILNEE